MPSDPRGSAAAHAASPGYRWNKAWRERHPERRHRWKNRYGLTTGSFTGPRLGQPWLADEDAAVLAHAVPDRELAQRLGRSLKAIQVRRTRLRTAEREEESPIRP